VRGHLERAHLEEAEPAALGAGAEQLVDAQLGAVGVPRDVDQQVAEQAINQPRPRLVAVPIELGERDLELVQALVAGLVDAGCLAGRADEPAGEQVRQ